MSSTTVSVYAFRGQWVAGLETAIMSRPFQEQQQQQQRGGELGSREGWWGWISIRKGRWEDDVFVEGLTFRVLLSPCRSYLHTPEFPAGELLHTRLVPPVLGDSSMYGGEQRNRA